MSSEKAAGKSPVPSSGGKCQKMLDSERQSKLDRMEAANAHFPFTRATARDSKMAAMNHQAPPQSSVQVMSATGPSYAIYPSSKCQSANRKPHFTATGDKSGGALMEVQSNELDGVSICRSPGWEDSKRRKKAKQEAKESRNREKEKAGKESTELRRPTRLTKAPPISKGMPTFSTSAIRSDTAPILHTSSPEPDTRQDKPMSSDERTSTDIGLKRVIPWQPANTTLPGEEAIQLGNQGFIGGLKLQQATQAMTQQTFREQMVPSVPPLKSNFVEEFGDAATGEGTFRNLRSESLNDASIELKRASCERNSIFGWALRKSDRTREKSKTYVPSERKGKLSASTSSVQQACVSQPIVSEFEPFQNLTLSRPEIADGSVRKSSKPSTVLSSKRPPVSYREPSQLAERPPRRGSFSFLLSQKQPSKERPTSSSQEESRLSTTTDSSTDRRSRSSSWSFFKGSRASSLKSRTANSFISSPDDEHQPSFDKNSRRYLTQTIRSSKEIVSVDASFSTSSHLECFDAAAETAFERYSKPSSYLLDSTESLNAEIARLPPVNFACLNSLKPLSSRSLRKAEKIISQGIITSESCNTYNIANEQTDQISKSPTFYESSDDHPHLDEKPTLNIEPASESQLKTGYSEVLDDTGNTNPPMSYSITNLAVPNKNISRVMQGNLDSDGKISVTGPAPGNHPSSINAQDLSFLPPLTHQPLTRPFKSKDSESSSAEYQRNLAQISPAHLGRPLLVPTHPQSCSSSSCPPSPRRSRNYSDRQLHNQRQILQTSASLPPVSLLTAGSRELNTCAKMLVICCNCRYFHDIPSKVYEYMAKPDNVVRDPKLGVSGVITAKVKCPWCGHGMSHMCCEGWAAVVVLKERLH